MESVVIRCGNLHTMNMNAARELAQTYVPAEPLNSEGLERQLDLLNMIQESNAEVLGRNGLTDKAYRSLLIASQICVDRAGVLARPVIYAKKYSIKVIKNATEIGVAYKFPSINSFKNISDQGIKFESPIALRHAGQNIALTYRGVGNHRCSYSQSEADLVFDMAHKLWMLREREGGLSHLDETLTTIYDPVLQGPWHRRVN